MRAIRGASVSALVIVGVCLYPGAAAAQENVQALRQEIDGLRRDFEALKSQYDQRLTALEQKLVTAEGAQPAPGRPTPAAPAPGQPPAQPSPAQPPTQTVEVPPGAAGAGGPAGALPVYGAGLAGSKVFNPDIAVIGDFLGAAGTNAVAPQPGLEMHESEASFQAVVDPYARADFFISFGETGVTLEEGYLTFTSLPGGLLTKVGKMRAAFGKVNTLHNHVLPWTDRPLVTQNLVGGEDGISDAGISVARLIPNPWLFLEGTAQVFRGDSGTDQSPLYKSSTRSDLSYVAHVRAYQDITEDSNVDVGFSYSMGHNGLLQTPNSLDMSTLTTSLYGIDATYRWRPLQRSIYRSFIGRSEIIWSRRDQPNGLQSGTGFYISGDYQFGRRWFAGARYDRSARAYDASLIDKGGSLILTYWPSEFSQVRGQYRRTNYGTGDIANEFLFQFQFSIGAHGAHPF
jgi:hypothetical protein